MFDEARATPLKPKIAATTATTKKINDHCNNIVIPLNKVIFFI